MIDELLKLKTVDPAVTAASFLARLLARNAFRYETFGLVLCQMFGFVTVAVKTGKLL